MGSSGLKARARAGVDRGVLGPSGCRRVGGVNGVCVPRCVTGVRGDVAGLGVRGWLAVLAGGAAPVWRSRSGVRGGSIVAKAVASCGGRGSATSGRVRQPRRCACYAQRWKPGSSWCLSGADTMSVAVYRF